MVTNSKNAFIMNIPVTQSDVQEEIEEIKSDLNDKLGLENGLIQLSNPIKLEGGWILAPANLADTIYEQIILYLQSNDACKAYKAGKSLLDSGHLINTMVHSVSPNVQYCFVRGLCFPEQKLPKASYSVWVILHKDTGAVINGHCTCSAG